MKVLKNVNLADCKPSPVKGHAIQNYKGFSKIRKFEEVESILKFSGVSKGNPSKVREGGFIFIPKEKRGMMYSKGLSKKNNNEAEYLALIEGLEIISKYGVRRIMIQGNSNLVTKQASKIWMKVAWRLEDLMLKAQELIDKLEKASLMHILRRFNILVDLIAKVGVSLDPNKQIHKSQIIPMVDDDLQGQVMCNHDTLRGTWGASLLSVSKVSKDG
eukprot:Gb_15119 [translate_table: standard]